MTNYQPPPDHHHLYGTVLYSGPTSAGGQGCHTGGGSEKFGLFTLD
jgi:hypothetical protein